ncbi:hypothetical protein [Spiroplasma turonicum]|uniref:Transmembrane protein n=1 Tax=Spiroplasma turonicum TaxID=216946 RepID=A0A0K1P729_9MOLU|nr:hypothetical protein [Spiroplasma turonicum]AKU79999.1 hypothetical protein STURON_00753 [Spiroplasma turonicum]ALX71001.1 hypothetical protein STURO_v1c07500 [Spiroplasma turonicum]
MKLDKLCKAGCIVTISLASVILFLNLVNILLLAINFNKIDKDLIRIFGDSNNIESIDRGLKILKVIFYIISITFCIPTIVLTAYALKGNLKSIILPSVLSIIFAGIIGGVLMLCGKYKNHENEEQTDNKIVKEEKLIVID